MSKGKNFSVDQLRLLLLLAINGIPIRDAGEQAHCSPSVVSAARRKLEAKGIKSASEITEMSDQEILNLYYNTGRAVWCKGDVVVIRENRRKQLTGSGEINRPNFARYVDMHLEKKLSREMCFTLYKRETYELDQIPVSRTTFLDGLRNALAVEIGPQDVSMRQDHRYGDEIGIDYCGDTFPVLMPDGTTQKYAICVLAWASSYMTYAELIPGQTTQDTCNVIAHAIQRWQCTARIITCDNAKSMVTQHQVGREPIFNRSFEQFVHSLGMTIQANKPYGPTGKNYVEKEVGLIQERCLTLMRMVESPMNLVEANTKLMELVDREINSAGFRNSGKGSPRKVLFEKYERPAALKFKGVIPEYREHEGYITVDRNYTVYVKGHYYSVPWRYAHDVVSVSLSATKVYISGYNGLIAEHIRCDGDELSTMLPEHMPEAHKAVALKRKNFPDSASVINASRTFSDTLYQFTQLYFKSHTMEQAECPLSIIRAYQSNTADHKLYDAVLKRLMELEIDKWTSYRYNKLKKEIQSEIKEKGKENVLSTSSEPKELPNSQHVCLHKEITISNAGRHVDQSSDVKNVAIRDVNANATSSPTSLTGEHNDNH